MRVHQPQAYNTPVNVDFPKLGSKQGPALKPGGLSDGNSSDLMDEFSSDVSTNYYPSYRPPPNYRPLRPTGRAKKPAVTYAGKVKARPAVKTSYGRGLHRGTC